MITYNETKQKEYLIKSEIISNSNISTITIDFAASLVLSLFVVFKISFVPTTVMQILKCASIALLVLLHRRAVVHIPHFWAACALACVQPLCTFLAGSSILNVLYAAVNGLCLISFLLMFRSLSDKFGTYQTLDSFFWLLFVASAVNDVTVLASSVHEADTEYLLGNKFILGYTHMLLIGLYSVLLEKRTGYLRYNWGLFWFIVLESAVVILRADCMTCILGLVVVVMLSILMSKASAKRFSSGIVCVVALICLNLLFFGTGMMLENQFAKYLIQDILGRSLTLTGRTQIYEALSEIIHASPYFGWGYGSSVVREYVGYGNAQNGIMELLVTYGIMGLGSFLLALLYLLPGRQTLNCGGAKGLVAVLYGMFFVSLVEISFGIVFYLILALVSVALRDSSSCKG